MWDAARSLLSDLISLAREAESVAEALGEKAESQTDRRREDRFDRLQAQLHQRDGYNLDHKIE